ncbi:TPA: adenine-specific DNA methylase [Escherichia coli]|nr:adenine-specific DNA methylase [Escherichia coli]
MHSQLRERIRLMRARLDNARPVIEIPADRLPCVIKPADE